MMISPNNPDLNVDVLMERVRLEVAAMRALSASHEVTRSVLGDDRRLPPIAVDMSRHAVVTELVEDAARMSRPRTAVPRRLERAPFSVLRPVVRFGLRVLNYAQKDQRHVNAATQQALRELLRLSVAIGNHVAHLSANLHEQRNVPRDIASIAARVAASEQRGSAFFERFGDLDERIAVRLDALEAVIRASSEQLDSVHVVQILSRIDALERAMTVNASRIDSIEQAPVTTRIGALEAAMTTNAHRIDSLEIAMTTNAGRIDTIETKPVDARLLGLETAQTIASQRLERLETFREYAAIESTKLTELQRDVRIERERALRSEASLRTDLTVQLNAANKLMDRAEGGDRTAISQRISVTSERYDDLHMSIADRFRGESAALATTFETYLRMIRETGTVNETHPLIDVGSGRGEWLGTLLNAGVSAIGLDLNSLLVARAREDGLAVQHGDALELLRAMNAGSVGALTAFHVIEHLSFEDLIAVFDEALRVLAPGGLLICETPNPANITIGACNFYLDPTHNRPLPSPLVAYLVELRGFTDVRIDWFTANDSMRIDEDTETARRVNDFFYGPQNYAVSARKPGDFN